jgi:hypothetical protein
MPERVQNTQTMWTKKTAFAGIGLKTVDLYKEFLPYY